MTNLNRREPQQSKVKSQKSKVKTSIDGNVVRSMLGSAIQKLGKLRAESLYGINLTVAYKIRSDATIVNMVAKKLGAALSPKLTAEPIPPGVQVYSLPVPLFRIISVAVLADSLLTPATYAFIDLLKQMSRKK